MLHVVSAQRRSRAFGFVFLVGVTSMVAGCRGESAQNTPSADTVWITIPSDAEDVIREVVPQAAQTMERRRSRGGEPLRLLEIPTARVEEISQAMHRERRRCGGFTAFAERREALRSLAPIGGQPASVPSYDIDNAPTVDALIGEVAEGRILATIEGLSAFPSRYYESEGGIEAAYWLQERWAQYIGDRTDARAELWQHAEWDQPSVVLTIEGTENPDEVVVIGGHLDSISFWGGSAPGADDDASGVATLSEVARVVLENGVRTGRTVKFMAYAAEEVGLRGSRDIADQFAANGVDVVGVVQLDMVNYQGSPKDIYLVQDNTHGAQNAFMRGLLEAYLPDLEVGEISCGYACSDHASWTANGYRASMPFEATMSEMNDHLHTPSDTLANSGGDAEHAAKFARLTAAYVAELANGTLPAAEP